VPGPAGYDPELERRRFDALLTSPVRVHSLECLATKLAHIYYFQLYVAQTTTMASDDIRGSTRVVYLFQYKHTTKTT